MSANINLQLNQLEDEIQELFEDGDLLDSRILFEMGVKFGRELQRANVNNYKFRFWAKGEQEMMLGIMINKEVNSINQILLSFIKKTIAEHLNETGTWSISYRDYDLRWSKFSDDIVEKYFIQYQGMETMSLDDFKCKFDVCGKLKELFDRFGLVTELTVNLVNSNGEDFLDISRTKTIEKGMYGIESILNFKKDWPLEKFKEFHQALLELFLFELID